MPSTSIIFQREAVRVDPLKLRDRYMRGDYVTTITRLLDTFRTLWHTRYGFISQNRALLVCADSINCALTVHDPDLYEVIAGWGLHELYQDIIMADGFFDEPVVFVDSVIEGLMSILSYVEQTGNTQHPITAAILSRAPSLWKHVWSQRHLLKLHTRDDHQYVIALKDPTVSPVWFEPIAQLIFAYHDLYQTQVDISWQHNEALIGSYVQHVALYCFVRFKDMESQLQDPEYRDIAQQALISLPVASSAHIDTLVYDVFFCENGASPERFASYFSRDLQHDESVTSPHYPDFRRRMQAQAVVACRPALLPYIAKHECHAHAVHSLSSMLPSRNISDGDFIHEWFNSSALSSGVLSVLEESALKGGPLAIYCRGEDLVMELARLIEFLLSHLEGFLVAMKAGPNDPPVPFEHHILLRLEHLTRVVNILREHHPKDSGAFAFMKSIKTGLYSEWWLSLSRMVEQRRLRHPDELEEGYDDLISRWSAFAHTFGLSQEEERRRYQGVGAPDRCSWLQCQYSRQALPDGKTQEMRWMWKCVLLQPRVSENRLG